MQPRPFRFAVQAANSSSRDEWRALARKIEELGYSTLFLADHYLGPGPAQRAAHTPRQDLAPITALATAAAITETLRVGCRVFCVDYHVPAALVKEAATLDLLSGGRLEFGIGAGWSAGEYGAMGLEFAAPGARIDKLYEVVDLFIKHCAGEELDQQGRFVNVAGYAGRPLPVQRPHPPVMIGGGRKRVLSYAGRVADIVSISNVPFVQRNEEGLTPMQEADRRVGYVRAAAGDRMARIDIESSPYFVAVTDDPADALDDIAASTSIPAGILAEHPNVLVGSVGSIIDTLRARRERFGINYVTVQQDRIDDFAPVVAALSGH